MKIISVVGARPNFMKIAPFIRAIDINNKNSTEQIEHILLHTGQHYDNVMSKSFFDVLSIPPADINLGIGSGTHAEQVGNTMIAFEKVLKKEKPNWVIVVGDVNATLACSVTAKKEHINLCHIEAGLRSRDMTMPEEINRLVTDRLSDLLLTPDRLSTKNLINEGTNTSHVVFVGNIMIDTLEYNRSKAENLNINDIIRKNPLSGNSIKILPHNYAVLTLHRPSNVDQPNIFTKIVKFLINDVSDRFPLIWPVHPRARKQLAELKLWDKLIKHKNIIMMEPIDYLEMLGLNIDAAIVLTDSGGLQEECCVLGTPFLTLRWNTERPITLLENGGTGLLVGNDIYRIKDGFEKLIKLDYKPSIPEKWDGKTAERCVEAILNYE